MLIPNPPVIAIAAKTSKPWRIYRLAVPSAVGRHSQSAKMLNAKTAAPLVSTVSYFLFIFSIRKFMQNLYHNTMHGI